MKVSKKRAARKRRTKPLAFDGLVLSEETAAGLEQFLKTVSHVSPTGDAGHTARELVKATRRSDKWVKQQLRELWDSGQLFVGSRPEIDMTGRRYLTPVYRLKRQ